MGRALVRTLAAEGHVLSVIGRRPPAGTDIEAANVHHWPLDISDRAALTAEWPKIIRRNGKLSNLVFFQRYRGDGERWKGEMETSLTATKDVIDLSVDEFCQPGDGSIVVVSSVASRLIVDEQPLSYHVAKAGLNQLVRYYAVTLGRKHIRVNSVSPGTTLKEESKRFYEQNNHIRDLYEQVTPLCRMGTSEDIANVISFLCSSKASFITGQDIVVDGGLSLRGHEALAREVRDLDNPSVTNE